MEFKWSVNKVTVAEDNLVTRVELTITAIDSNNIASATYTRNLVRSSSFTPYDQLTEEQVLAWCFSPEITTWKDFNGDEQIFTRLIKDEGEAQVAGQIARQLAQKAAEPALPWAVVTKPK